MQEAYPSAASAINLTAAFPYHFDAIDNPTRRPTTKLGSARCAQADRITARRRPGKARGPRKRPFRAQSRKRSRSPGAGTWQLSVRPNHRYR